MQPNGPVGDELDTYSEAVDKLAETTGEHSRSLKGLDSAMANLNESVVGMNSVVDEYSDALDEFDDAVVSLQQTATREHRPRADTPTARPRQDFWAASDQPIYV